MASFVIYEAATGAIWSIGHCPDADIGLQPLPPGHALLAGCDVFAIGAVTHYVAEGKLAAGRVLAFDKLTIAANDTDVATLTGLPDPCSVTIAGIDHTITGGVLEVTSAQRA